MAGAYSHSLLSFEKISSPLIKPAKLIITPSECRYKRDPPRLRSRKLPPSPGTARRAPLSRLGYPSESKATPIRHNHPLIHIYDTNPPKTPIGMNPRSVLLDPSVFPNPHSFIPERWIPQDPAGQKNNPDRYFVAFGKGSRMCQGMKYVCQTPLPKPETVCILYSAA